MVKILFKRLTVDAVAPKRAHDGDAGFDIRCTSCDTTGSTLVYHTGLAFAIPKGYWMMIVPRSSIYKTGLILANSCGVVDSGYRGEVQAHFYTTPRYCTPYTAFDKICQAIIMPCKTDEVEFEEADELPESWDGRGECGFGSTGR